MSTKAVIGEDGAMAAALPHLKDDGDRFVRQLEDSLVASLSISDADGDMQLPAELASRAAATPADVERALDFLRARFFRDEPLNRAVRLLDEETPTCRELDEYCSRSLAEGLSTLVVRERDDAIVAVGVNGAYRRDEVLEDYSVGCENPKFKKILKLLYKVNKESDIFGLLHDVDVILDMKIISVDESYRGRGLGHFLLQKANEIARSQNISVVRCECSSHFSARVMEKMGSTKIYALKYEDYVEDGEPVFRTEAPHTEISIYYYRF